MFLSFFALRFSTFSFFPFRKSKKLLLTWFYLISRHLIALTLNLSLRLKKKWWKYQTCSIRVFFLRLNGPFRLFFHSSEHAQFKRVCAEKGLCFKCKKDSNLTKLNYFYSLRNIFILRIRFFKKIRIEIKIAAKTCSKNVKELGQQRLQYLGNYQQNYEMMQNSERASQLFQRQMYIPVQCMFHHMNYTNNNNQIWGSILFLNNVSITIKLFITVPITVRIYKLTYVR